MPKTPLPDHDTPPDPRTELLADLDARIGEPAPADTNEQRAADDAPDGLYVRPEQVDLMLRLHQLGAAWRERVGKEMVGVSKRIERFEIMREVGQGGFATVYEATDTLLGRTVALKVAHPEALVSPSLRRRFLREAELASKVTHPNLVTIHDIGESEGVTFIAEEFCNGGTLAAWLDRHPGPVAPRLAAEIIRAIAQGLDAAHHQAIVHRDIKPSNILLARGIGDCVIPEEEVSETSSPGPGWCVKLGDFGLGLLDDDTSADPLSRLTRAGATLGTPTWMAPEQIDRTHGSIGPATDVHALGLLLDRFLTGRCRWIGDSDSETMRRILLREPDSIGRAVTGVPRDLLAVTQKCLARSPSDRYARAGDLAADLNRFLLGVPTRARPLSGWERACRGASRHPLAVVGCAAALLAMMITVMALWGWSFEASAAARQRRSLQQIGAAMEIQRGLADLAAGNSDGARTKIAAVASLDPALDGSFLGRWAKRRLRGERELLYGDRDVVAATDSPSRDLYSCAVAPDGTRIAAGGGDGRLVLLDAVAKAQPIVVVGAHDEINDIAFSPDGRLVATAGQDGRVKLFSADTGAPEGDVAAEAKPLFAVTFSPDGERLAWAGAERTLAIESLGGGEVTRMPVPLTIEPGTEGSDVEAVLFVDDDTVAIAGGAEVMLLSITDGSVIRRFVGHSGSVGSLDLSPDRTRLVSAGTDRVPRVWDVASGRLRATLPVHPHWVQGCVFTADGQRIVTGCRDGVLQVFDASAGVLLERLPGHVGRTWDLRREPGGMVVSTGADGTVRRWSTEPSGGVAGGREWSVPAKSVVRVLPMMTAAPSMPDGGAEVIVVRSEGVPLVVDAESGRDLAMLPHAPRAFPVDAAVDPSRGRIALVTGDGVASVFAIPDVPSDGHVFQGEIHRFAWTASGQAIMLTRHPDGLLVGRDASLGEEIQIGSFGHVCLALSVAPDGSTIAAGGLSLLHLTPIATRGRPRAVGATRQTHIEPSFGGLAVIAWSPEGHRIAIGSTTGHVRILDARSGDTLQVLSGHRGSICAIAWSADGRAVISADAESFHVSDSATAVMIDSCTPGWAIRSLALAGPSDTPDRWLVVGGEATEERLSANGEPGRGRVMVVDIGS